MSGIIAIFNRNGRPVEPELPERMLAARPERGPDGVAVRIEGPVAVGYQLFRLLPEDRADEQPIAGNGLLFAADCRLDNRPELALELGLDAVQAAMTSDAGLILLAYEKWGDRCPERLLGDFAFAVWDGQRQCLFVARDPMGGCDVCVAINDSVCLVASEISQLLAHPAVRPRINDRHVAAFLLRLDDGQEETFYEGITYLPPAHALTVFAGRVDRRRFWEPRPEMIRYRDERQYAEHYRELLSAAVRCRLRSTGPVGISLSGGLDSTALAALAAPVAASGGSRLKSFSYAFDELASCDERDYIRPVVDRYDLDASYIPSDERWTLKDLPAWPTSRDYVMADAYVWLPDAVRHAAARAGVRLLLAGYYGEYLMTGQNYWALDILRDRRGGLLVETLRSNRRTIRWRESFLDFGLRRLIPPGVARAFRRVRPRQVASLAPGIHPGLLSHTGLLSRPASDQPEALSAPGLAARFQTMTGAGFGRGGNMRHAYNRLGTERALPFTDRRLLEFVLSVPAYVIGRPGADRRLQREAMAGLLPEAVRQRRPRTEFWPLMLKGLRDRERDTMRRIMVAPQVVERGYIDGEWLKNRLQVDFDASADSLLLWLSVSLELWLQRYWS